MNPEPVRLEHVIALNVAKLREQRGWTQAGLAHRMNGVGLPWTPNRATQVETLRRPVSLFETIGLAWVFGVSVRDLLEGEDRIVVRGGAAFPLASFRETVSAPSGASPED